MKRKFILIVCVLMMVVVLVSACSKDNDIGEIVNSGDSDGIIEEESKIVYEASNIDAQLELIFANKSEWEFSVDEASFGTCRICCN